MSPPPANLSADLAHIAQNPRVLVRRDGEPRTHAKCVVYWMQRAMRIVDNPALDVAVDAADVLGLPVVVYFQVIPNYPNANLRHYHFLQQGLRDVAEDAAEQNIGFIVRRTPAKLEEFLEQVNAAMLIGDENPCREPERWRKVLAGRLTIPYWTVDADVVVPSRVFGRSFVLFHHFRPKLKTELPKFLLAPANSKPRLEWKKPRSMDSYSLQNDITAGFTNLDRKVGPVDSFIGGTHSAVKRLKEFVRHDLSNYDDRRNHPETRGTSRLSPYLHFGNIGPLTIALAVQRAMKEKSVAAESGERFLDQVIGWRELAALFVRYEPDYDNWDCAAPWARKTLIEHAGDSRQRYSFEQIEQAVTGDDLWNAAQREMVVTGWMHNYMRMYWAKKILEWAPDPATAFEWAIKLNDRYELDGRDPNGYAGIAWAIVGKLDRPWFNRPVFGLVRPMSGRSIAKKFDAEAYKSQHPPR